MLLWSNHPNIINIDKGRPTRGTDLFFSRNKSVPLFAWGTYGEVANVPAHLTVKHPHNLSFLQAAASWMQYVTAWGALVEQAKLTTGDFVLVTAASSSVGSTAIAVTRTRAKQQALLDAGAHHVIVSDEENLVERVMQLTDGQGARVVFDPIGGPGFEALTQNMAQCGILLEYGALSAEPTPFPLFTVLGKCLTLKGYLYAEIVADPAALARAKAFILDGLASGALAPVIAKTFGLDEVQEAHRYLEANQQVGKVVVTV